MHIFLSGKVDAKHGAWRDEILGKRVSYQDRGLVESPRWEVAREIDWWKHSADLNETEGFPREPNNFVLGLHNYVGPYRLTTLDASNKGSGYFHGCEGSGQHGFIDEDQRAYVVRECQVAVARAEFVFAFVNTPDCFGTLTEVGYAKALGKYVHVTVLADAAWEPGDFWFAELLADASSTVYPDLEEGLYEPYRGFRTVADAFKDALVQWTARPPAPVVTSIARVDTIARDAASSFSQIARWTSDPRVRSEAERMVRRLSAG